MARRRSLGRSLEPVNQIVLTILLNVAAVDHIPPELVRYPIACTPNFRQTSP
jgi:hypothetical protein